MHSPIKLWATDDRPREKLLKKGPEAVSNAELLAILIQNGTPNSSALDLAKQILDICDNRLHQLSRMSVHDILQMKIRGIGPAKAVSIAAALALASRREMEQKAKIVAHHSEDYANYFKPLMQFRQHEVLMAIYMDAGHRILCHQVISTGGLESTDMDVRVIFKQALQFGAACLVLAHNHPSGAMRPSHADVEMTTKAREAGNTLNIILLDHLIITDGGFFSFVDHHLFR